ncbi:UNVERIFIED_CONTAM: Rhomboid-like protein 14, mitochondrial [Sesamum angustifolium]|uniref:Rhomboid-like protein 14, mitochondrial n=1 Tax=Sesamum angustifolium TaxID=2727405 RepID=A0AAW2IM79_9LAMI
MERGRGRGGMLGLLLLQALSEYCRLERKPPVTAGLIAANTLIYLRPKFLHPILPSLNQVWFNPYLILKHKDLKRFILSAFYHIGESHLVYNMLSLLWKGIQLESAMGSIEYASMVAALVARYAAWAELILIQMFVPGVSFLGHLGGILAGLLYVYLKSSHSGANPLTKIIRGLTSLLGWPLRFVNRMFRHSRSRVFGRGTIGGSETRNLSGVWRCRACTYDNIDLLNVCEMCGTDRNGDAFWPSDGDTESIPLQELRQRRVQRFGQ